MANGYTTVTSAHVEDSSGTLISNATAYFVPETSNGVPLSFRVGGDGGVVVTRPVFVAVASGGFSIQLADTSLTSPVNIGYRMTVVDNISSKQILNAFIQPFGDTWSLDTDFDPKAPYLITAQAGPGGTIAIGTVTTGAPGSSATVTNSGSTANAVFNFEIPTGAPGEITKALLASSLQTQIAATSPAIRNLLDVSRETVGFLQNNGNISTDNGWRTSPLMPVGTDATIVCNFDIPAGICAISYDVTGTLLSLIADGTADVPAGTPIFLPTLTYYVRVSHSVASQKPMVNNGSVLSPTYLDYGYVAITDLTTQLALYAKETTLTGIINALSDATRNLVDPAKWILGFLNADGSFTSDTTGQYIVSPYLYIGDMTEFVQSFYNLPVGSSATTFYDANYNKISDTVGLGSGFDKVVSVPEQAVFVRLATAFGGGFQDGQHSQAVMGTVLDPTPKPPLNWPNISAAIAVVNAANKPFAGKKALVTGDSITAGGEWQITGLTGVNQMAILNSVPPAHNYNGAWTAGTSYAQNDLVYFTDGIYYLSLVASNVGNSPATSPTQWVRWNSLWDLNGRAGEPLASALYYFNEAFAANPTGPTVVQQLTNMLLDKSLMVHFWGTNDGTTPVGTIADAATSAQGISFYGNMEYLLNTCAQAVAAVAVANGNVVTQVFVTPYNQSRAVPATLAPLITAIKQKCQQYGVPVLDLTELFPMNPTTWAAYSADTVHPNALGFTMLGSLIGRQVLNLAL